MSTFKKGTAITVSVSIFAAPAFGKDANGMVNDLGKYTGMIANSTTSDAIIMGTVQFKLHDGTGKTVEAPARPIKPVVRYRAP